MHKLPADTFTFPHSYGVIDRSLTYTYGALHHRFDLASVTKLLTSWSALIAVEQRIIEFTTPAGPTESTVRNLLTHTSGLAFDSDTVLAKPGARRIYSNRGIEVLGEAICERTGVSIQEWIESTVLSPLAMGSTAVAGSPAYSGTSTLSDMAIFANELANPTLISPLMATAAHSVQFPGIPGTLPGYGHQAENDWGLGCEIRGTKAPHWTGSDFSPRTYGHFGQSGSFLWVDPVIKKAGVFLGEAPFGQAHRKVWPDLTNQMRAV